MRALVDDMRDSLKAVEGGGLAAPQIGVPLALGVFEVSVERAQAADGDEAEGGAAPVLINPLIVPLSDETAFGWEGCQSVPGLRGVVPRHALHTRHVLHVLCPAYVRPMSGIPDWIWTETRFRGRHRASLPGLFSMNVTLCTEFCIRNG